MPSRGECQAVASARRGECRARLGERVDRRATIPMRALRSDACGDMDQGGSIRCDRLKVDPQAIPLAESQGAQCARHGPGE